MFKTVAEALAHKFIGNHLCDYAAFDAIERMAKKASAADKRALLRHIAVNGMGIDE